eukprot:tig00020848_g14578.t1
MGCGSSAAAGVRGSPSSSKERKSEAVWPGKAPSNSPALPFESGTPLKEVSTSAPVSPVSVRVRPGEPPTPAHGAAPPAPDAGTVADACKEIKQLPGELREPDVPAILCNLAKHYRNEGDFAAAKNCSSQAVLLRHGRARAPPPEDLISCINNLCCHHVQGGRLDDAFTLLKQALKLAETALGPGPHAHLATVLSNLAGIHELRGDLEAAEPLAQRSLEVCEAALGPSHPDVAGSLNNLAWLHLSRGRPAEAEAGFKASACDLESGLQRASAFLDGPIAAAGAGDPQAGAQTSSSFGGIYKMAEANLKVINTNTPASGTGHPLDCFFFPRGIAVVGATEKEGSVGRTVIENLVVSPSGAKVYGINPKRPDVLGVKCYTSVLGCPDDVDLVVICIPAKNVPPVIEECGKKGVRGVIIISAGFQEEQVGDAGKELLRQVLETAHKYNIRIIGPNCLGVSSSLSCINASFGPATAPCIRGNVALVSQSGALICALLDWARFEDFGFSHVVSLGSMSDIEWSDMLDYLAADPRCSGIVIYMETIGKARETMAAARRVSLHKPVVVIKAGRSEAGAKAAASHTGTMTGGDVVMDAVFARCGALRVPDSSDIYELCDVLATQPIPKGNRLAIITNAGGPGILCTDALSLGGGTLAELSAETYAALNTFLPSVWSHSNPVDIIGDANAEHYARTTEVIAKDPNIDGVVVILTPQAMTESTESAKRIVQYLGGAKDKPIFAVWMGGHEVEAGREILKQAGIAVFELPDLAAKTFNYMWQYSSRLERLYQPPPAPVSVVADEIPAAARQEVAAMIESARARGQVFLPEYESKRMLALYRIPVTDMRRATDADTLAAHADAIGYPVVVKLDSTVITHKADVGGVHLNLTNAEMVKAAFKSMATNPKIPKEAFEGATVQRMLKLGEGYETIVGANIDGQVGPVLLFGTGGTLVEVYKDSALALPPLTAASALRMLEETKIYHVFKGVRGRAPIDTSKVVKAMLNFSQLICDHPYIKELDINPLFVSAETVIALDARVVLHEKEVKLESLPVPALRPYPVEYIRHTALPDGRKVTLRPVRMEDEPYIAALSQNERAKAAFEARFAPRAPLIPAFRSRFVHICMGEYVHEIASVAVDDATGALLALARLSRVSAAPAHSTAEYALVALDGVVEQAMQRYLLAMAQSENYRKLVAGKEDAKALERVGVPASYFAPADKGALELDLTKVQLM